MEIIKQGFLANLQGKKVYAVFCIRNNEPLLEIYAKKIHLSTHAAQHILELKKTKYVGLKIPRNISESSFEFVIVLASEVFSFSCKRQDLMNDWINCLKTKLRELKVLSPKENIYTKPPAMRPILQMTRNPRDPLPECPPISSDRIPGLEVLQTATRIESSQSRTTIISTEPVSENENTQIESIIESFTVSNSMNINVNNINNNNNTNNDIDDEDDSEQAISIPIFNFATSNTSSQNLINLLSNPLCRYTSNNTDLQFANSFNYDDDSEDEEEDDNRSNESEKELTVLPTSVNIECSENLGSSDNNITIIPIESNANINNNNHHHHQQQQHISKLDESKVTKIKIEVGYEALSSTNSTNNQNGSEEHHHIKTTIPSTSSFIKKVEKESAKSAPNTPKRIPIAASTAASSSTSNTPKHEKRKLSLREQQVLQLRHEINTDEIRFKLRKKDCVDAIAFASYNGQLYIAGFKPNPQLYVFHIGDQLLAINNIANIKSPADAHKFIKMCAGLFVEVTIKRLPFAGIFVIKRDFENQCLGLIRDGSSLLDIVPNSIASKSGIPSRPYTSRDDDSIFWIITEINFRPLSLISHKKYDETELLLNNAVGLETSLLLQPSDFIAKIKKELKAMKNYRDYTLQ